MYTYGYPSTFPGSVLKPLHKQITGISKCKKAGGSFRESFRIRRYAGEKMQKINRIRKMIILPAEFEKCAQQFFFLTPRNLYL